MPARIPAIAWLLVLLALTGCQSVYYSTMEQLGLEKRDLLVDSVEDTREAQQEARKQFESALAEFMSVTEYEGGALEAKYDRLRAAYEASAEQADAVRERIAEVEDVAGDLFAEWERELEEYSDPAYRRRSEEQLRATEQRYQDLIATMGRAESRMAPVLDAFEDRVLYLKHNLNARAIGALREDADEVRADVDRLLEDMRASIEEANAFIDAMGSGG